MSSTLVKIALSKLIGHDDPVYSNFEALESLHSFLESEAGKFSDSQTHAAKTKDIISKILAILSDSANSIFLTIAKLKRPHETNASQWLFQYMIFYPSDGRVALQYIAFTISKKGTFYRGSEMLDKPIILSNHVIDRIFDRYAEGIIKTDYKLLIFVLKLSSINIIANRLLSIHGLSDAPLDKIPVGYGHFTLIENNHEIIVTTYIDEGLYNDDQDFLASLAQSCDAAANLFVHRYRAAMIYKKLVALNHKQYRVLSVNDYHPTAYGLSDIGYRKKL